MLIMKIKIPLMIQDPLTSTLQDIEPTEGFHPDNEEFFLDGPTSKRIAVLDFSPETGEVLPGAIFKRPPPGRVLGWYENASGDDLMDVKGDALYEPVFQQVSVFATVLKTMYLFEGRGDDMRETLGRPLMWAFDSPQLLVVPRAGQQANAYYHRDSSSLQFFSFPHPSESEKTIYTCLSRDIVAHETGHAIVDGIAPDLLDSCTPQSLAIHEAIADLTALLMAFESHNLAQLVLDKHDGSLGDSTEFSFIAEEFGAALKESGRGLRNLHNEKSLNPRDGENFVGRNEPHALSEVLSGALYRVMINIHENLKDEYAETPEYQKFPDPRFSASGRALAVGAYRLKRMVFRALDYLPPGEVSFADYGRAIIAVDEVAYPKDDNMRNWIRDEFVNRNIVQDRAALEVQTNFEHEALEGVDIPTLHESDWVAYDFANRYRPLFHIPFDTPFRMRPRLSLEKRYDEEVMGHECICRVSWDHIEANPIGHGHSERRRITVGTTLAVDWDTGRVLARLTNAPPLESYREGKYVDADLRRLAEAEYEQQRKDRDEFLQFLASEGLLRVGRHAIGPDGQPLLSVIPADVKHGIMHTRSTGNMLHIAGQR